MDTELPTFARICKVVSQIPAGRVATYGQIASIVGKCTPRMVGYAMAGLAPDSPVPWQRVINAQGKISPRSDGGGAERQRLLLEEEGVRFDTQGRTNLDKFGWQGPDTGWLLENGFDPRIRPMDSTWSV